MRVLEIAEAAPPLGARLRLVSWWMYGVGLLALAVSAIGDAGADGAGWAYGMVIAGVSCLWSGNVVGALGRWRTTFVYVGFHLSVALFLLANPVISSLGRIPFSSAPERRGASGALWLLALSLVAIRIGSEVFENRYRSPTSPRGRVPHQPNRWAQRILLVATMIALAVSFVSTLGAWLFVRDHSYAEYYTTDTSTLPAALDIVGATAAALVACYLAQFPRDRSHLVVLGGLVVTTVPQLAMGLRGPFISAIVLAVAYVLLRWRLLGGIRFRVPIAAIAAVVVAIPVAMAGLGALNYARFDKASTSGLDPVTDFVYSQSISFSIVSRGLELYPNLPDHASKNYSLGSVTDYLMFGRPAQVLFDAEPLGGNTVRHATEGHEFSHAFSYYLYGAGYLEGLGGGSSYLVETYIDGGPLLVGAFSLLVGALVMFLGVGYTRSWLRAAVMLMVLPGVLLIPRGNATGFLLPLFLPHFWLAVGFTVAVRWAAPLLEMRRGSGLTASDGSSAPRRRAEGRTGRTSSRA